MNLQEALDTANWLLERASVTEQDTQHILRVRKMRDTLYMIYTAVGVHEIVLNTMQEEDERGYG